MNRAFLVFIGLTLMIFGFLNLWRLITKQQVFTMGKMILAVIIALILSTAIYILEIH